MESSRFRDNPRTIGRNSEWWYTLFQAYTGKYRHFLCHMPTSKKRQSTSLDTFTETLSLDDSKYYQARKYMVATWYHCDNENGYNQIAFILTSNKSRNTYSHTIHVWYIYQHSVDFSGFHIGIYTSPMDPMGFTIQTLEISILWYTIPIPIPPYFSLHPNLDP